MTPRSVALFALAVAGLSFSGCFSPSADDTTYAEMGFDGTHWPDLHGATVVVLDHGAFDYTFGPAKERFEALTNGTLEHIAAQDTGDALNRAIREKGRPSFDVVYGLDNAYLGTAIASGALQPYTPLLAPRVNASYVFFGDIQPWPATPVDHGYIAVNLDTRVNLTIADLGDLREHANEFATQDPRTSSPGLGFLLATIATFPEGSAMYDWHDYWQDLFANGVTITSDWTTAYTQHFTGGYGQWEDGFVGSKPLVTSYSTSPAYELYYGGTDENQLVLAPKATFHQVETVAIAANARELAGAQAFVEFVLTDGFQDLHAELNAMYPVVDGIDVAKVYNHTDPAPGSFQSTEPDYQTLAANVERWVREWTDLYEAHQA
ncbi:MAG: thiamine ABC transporter substrate-binding protein [Candidatus Thermoplasmatota archaeon]